MIHIHCDCEICGKSGDVGDAINLPEGFTSFAIHQLGAQNVCRKVAVLCDECAKHELSICKRRTIDDGA